MHYRFHYHRIKGTMLPTKGIGANLTNDEKRAHLTDLKREHLIDQARQIKSTGLSFQTRDLSHRLMFIGARLTAAQSAACPNPSREAKRRGNGKRQKGLYVVFHAVLQYT
jgi:hypothetical protein